MKAIFNKNNQDEVTEKQTLGRIVRKLLHLSKSNYYIDNEDEKKIRQKWDYMVKIGSGK